MSTESYRVVRLDEIEETSDGRCPWRAVRHHLGITAFGINAWTARDVGDRIINEHDEDDDGDRQEELYLVLEGGATFELDGERIDAPAGTLVFAGPGAKRTAFAEKPGTTILAIGGAPGEAYEPSGWEAWSQVDPLYRQGDYAAAVEQGGRLVEANPQYGAPFYNLACCESLAGLPAADAVEHLRQAIELMPRLRELARTDADFDPIRDEPAFKELLG